MSQSNISYDIYKAKRYVIGDNKEKYEYNKEFIFNIDAYYRCIQPDLIKGYFFEKYVTMAIYAVCNEGDIIFDVGANNGSVTIPCAKNLRYMHLNHLNIHMIC